MSKPTDWEKVRVLAAQRMGVEAAATEAIERIEANRIEAARLDDEGKALFKSYHDLSFQILDEILGPRETRIPGDDTNFRVMRRPFS